MTNIGFEPDRVQRWLTTPIGAKIADDNPALHRAADVMLEAMSATGVDPLMKFNLLVKGLALTLGTWGLGNTGEPPDDSKLKDLCDNLGHVTWLETADFLKKLRRDIRVRRHA